MPINTEIELAELERHLYSIPNIPNAIPYVTSYYEKRWGFCISHNEKIKLKNGKYKVFIDSKFNPNGSLIYGTLDIGATNPTDETILITTYLCHPQMANNELSGPAVWVELIKWLKNLPNRRYNYKFLINPETIGSIAFISQNYDYLKSNIKAGFTLSCIGDDGDYSIVLSPNENSLSDRAALNALKFTSNNPKIYSFLNRGSDERQFNTPNLNLGTSTLCRTKFGEFKQYHTSLDDLDFVTPSGLEGGILYAKRSILNLELNQIYSLNTTCEPNLGSRGLISTINKGDYPIDMMNLRHFLAYCDGKNDALKIAEKLHIPLYSLQNTIEKLIKFDLIKAVKCN